MVTRRGRRGASTLGCLVSLVLFIGALYYGVQVGKIYYRYYALVDEMEAAARFASARSDDAIRRTIIRKIDELGVPPEAKRVQVRRSGPPYIITIRTEYREPLNLPVGPDHLVLRPRVEFRF